MSDAYDTSFSRFIICPGCGHEDCEPADYPANLRHDGDSTTMECDVCHIEYEVIINIDITFSTALARGGKAGDDAP